jgi:PAS domain S-box-containing protein
MEENSYGFMISYAKKMAKLESKVEYLESILDNLDCDNLLDQVDVLKNYKKSPRYEKEDDPANDQNFLFFKAIMESMPFPVFIKDEHGVYQVLNSLEADLFGVPEEEIIGKSDDFFIKDEDELSLIKESDLNVLNAKSAIELPEQKFSLPNGSSYTFKTYKIPFFNPITRKTNIFGFSMDVTDSIQLNHLKKVVLLCSNPLL